jgi:outer membrane lipoprotein-sorting protein
MRRVTWMLAVVMCLVLVAVGCGKRDAGSIVKDLDHVMNKMDSYQGAGRMVLNTSEQPQEYQVEVWYMNPNFYRISLKNAEKDITQIVLRNEQGVFVLTPHLKKSFRFQSDWPENQGQVYLYQSLVQSIMDDKNRVFASEKNAYVFVVLANYQNEMLARQKIWLDKKNLTPQHVEVLDTNQKVMVTVDFTSFELGKKFEKDAFDMERYMTSWNLQTMPTMAGQTDKQQGFGIIEPSYIPQGVVKQDTTDMKLGEDQAVMLRYKGKYNYSLVEVRPQAMTVSLLPGTIVDLGYTLGVLTGLDKKTLTWIHEGVEYRLSTADLPMNEMMKVATAVQGQLGK